MPAGPTLCGVHLGRVKHSTVEHDRILGFLSREARRVIIEQIQLRKKSQKTKNNDAPSAEVGGSNSLNVILSNI
eukprot:3143564-Amphidinium_carterae.1